MPSCVFRKCTNYTATVKDMDISFHNLPKDEPMRSKWVHIIRTQRREDDWMPATFSTVCSKHFLASDIYQTKKLYWRVKKTALPVIEHNGEITIPSPKDFAEVNISDVECVIETPKEIALKLKLEKEYVKNRDLRRCNHNLMRKNKRLIEKCDQLKKVISRLKNGKFDTELSEVEIKIEPNDCTYEHI